MTPDGKETVEEDDEGDEVDHRFVESLVSRNFDGILDDNSSFAEIYPDHSESKDGNHKRNQSTIEDTNEQ